MSLTIKYSDPRGLEEPAVLVSLGSNIRFGDLGLALNAAQGEPAISTVEIDDPGGIYTFAGLRAFDVRETSAASNNQMIGRFAIQDREIHRNPERGFITGADRSWAMDLTDYNWHLGKRILVDADANRAAESAGDRITWLLNSAAHISLNDYGHVTYPAHLMDATDYRGQRANDVLADCSVEGQFNFWCDFNEAHGRPELFFIDPNDSTDTYAASITISNVLSDVDSSLTFAPYEDATLRRSPTRIAFGVYLAYANGAVYQRNTTTGDQYGQQDQAAPLSNVKTAARADRVATVFLNKNDSETDVITCAIKVPRAQVNDVRHGQLMQVRFSHLPGYETAQIVRVTRKQVIQEDEGGQGYYRIGLEMVPLDPPVAVGTGSGTTVDYEGAVFAGLKQASIYGVSSPHFLGFTHTYDQDLAGWGKIPVTGPIHTNGSVDPYLQVVADAAMTVRLQARSQYSNVYIPAKTFTLNITVNGVVVGTSSQVAGPGFFPGDLTVDVRNYHLAAGDIVSVTGTLSDDWGGSGSNSQYLWVFRGDYTSFIGITGP